MSSDDVSYDQPTKWGPNVRLGPLGGGRRITEGVDGCSASALALRGLEPAHSAHHPHRADLSSNADGVEEGHIFTDEEMRELNEEYEKMSADEKAFLAQSSQEHMLESTMEIFRTMEILKGLRDLMQTMDIWDQIILYYAYELLQRNLQTAQKLTLYIYKTSSTELVHQIFYWSMLVYTLSNVQTSYAYLIYRIYQRDRELAFKIHAEMKSFVFFEKSEDLMGSHSDDEFAKHFQRRTNGTDV